VQEGLSTPTCQSPVKPEHVRQGGDSLSGSPPACAPPPTAATPKHSAHVPRFAWSCPCEYADAVVCVKD
jgi:hypothetical protein